ncbi:putative phosphoglucomutase (alpha-D-glucose-1,6-bisphosphate-dependent) [Helianthus anomalus]
MHPLFYLFSHVDKPVLLPRTSILSFDSTVGTLVAHPFETHVTKSSVNRRLPPSRMVNRIMKSISVLLILQLGDNRLGWKGGTTPVVSYMVEVATTASTLPDFIMDRMLCRLKLTHERSLSDILVLIQHFSWVSDHSYPTHNVTYTSLVQGLCMLGNLNQTLQFIHHQLVHARLVPNVLTYSIRLKVVFSVSCSPLATKIIVGHNNASPIEGQTLGTSGIRKKVRVLTQPHYLYEFDHSMSNALSATKFKGFKFVSGGVQYYSKGALQLLITLGNGGPTPEGTTPIFFEHTKTKKEYFIIEGLPNVAILTLGISNFLSPDGHCDDLFYSASDYTLLMKSFFDLRSIKKLSTSTQFRFCNDAHNGVVEAYANYIIVEALNAKESSLLNSLNSSMDLSIISIDSLYGHKPPNIDHSTRTFLGYSATCDKIFIRPHRLLDSHLEDKVVLKRGGGGGNVMNAIGPTQIDTTRATQVLVKGPRICEGAA